ncbi:MAG: cell wall metabolism sensor histidine kinase WalK [Firmicutes bacterium]|nr:cell wall metabolism sensor histidine kinase WalK [Bacillota bacterium]
MRTSIRWKLAVTYFIIIILTVLLADWLAYSALRSHYLQERQESYQIHANVISTYAGEYIRGRSTSLPLEIREYGNKVNARVLVLSSQGVVLGDSFNEKWLEGRNLEYPEVQQALKGETAAGTHNITAGEWAMYVAVPVTRQKSVIGAVLLVTNIGDIAQALNTLAERMLILSIIGSALAALIGLWLSVRLTKPVQELTVAVKKVADGNLNQHVVVRSRDELGQLAESFNGMAEKLAKADRARRDFIASASHELKSPLASIKALAESLIYSSEDDVDVYKEYLGDINKEIDRLNRLVYELLQLAKMEDVSVTLHKKEHSVKEIIENVIQLTAPNAKAKKVTITADIEGDLAWPVDEDVLSVILLNLVDNGIKYTSATGEVKIKGNIKNETLQLQVTDTGEGIPEEDLKHIFDRFYRVDKARARETGGTGLGLSIVKQAVALLDGTVSVQSTVGKGTTFTVCIPKDHPI